MDLYKIALLAICLFLIYAETQGKPRGSKNAGGGKGDKQETERGKEEETEAAETEDEDVTVKGGKGGGRGGGGGGKGKKGGKQDRQERRQRGRKTVSVSDLCYCAAEGDPHYTDNEGERFDFQGRCEYMLSRLDSPTNPECNFEVLAKNEDTDPDLTAVTTTKKITITIGNDEIELGPKDSAKVNGVSLTTADYYPPDVNWNIDYYDRYFHVVITDCNITIKWDGRHRAKVETPKSFGQYLSGVCGECVLDPVNYCTNNGQSFVEDDGSCNFVDYVQSFQTDDSTCRGYVPQDVQTCDDEKTQEASEKCSSLDLSRDNLFSSFIQDLVLDDTQIALISQRATTEFEDCIFDVCAFIGSGQEDEADDSVCQYINNFVESVGEVIPGQNLPCWRSASFCPETCGENMEFTFSLGSELSCITGELEPVESLTTCGCQCKEGFYRVADKCVAECGCYDEEGGVRRLGEEFVTADCMETRRCDVPGSESTTLLENRTACSAYPHSVCGVTHGEPACVCLTGYTGDGIHCEEAGPADEEEPPADEKEEPPADEEENPPADEEENPPADEEENPPANEEENPPADEEKEDNPPADKEDNPPEDEEEEQPPAEENPAEEAEEGEPAEQDEAVPPPCNHDPSLLQFVPFTGPVKDPNRDYPECIEDGDPKGIGFFGSISTTRTGKQCQAWGEQFPNSHHYDNLESEGNYCRNRPYAGMAGIKASPWCYAIGSDHKWEYCDVPHCGQPASATPTSLSEDDIGCYEATTNGADYEGLMNMVAHAQFCDMWPKEKGYDYDDNRCRNPEPSERSKPWCYVKGEKTDCDIPSCSAVAIPVEIANPPTCTIQMADGKCKANIFLIGTGCKMEFNYPDECDFKVQQVDKNTYVVHTPEGVKTLSHLTPEYQSAKSETCGATFKTDGPKKLKIVLPTCPMCANSLANPAEHPNDVCER